MLRALTLSVIRGRSKQSKHVNWTWKKNRPYLKMSVLSKDHWTFARPRHPSGPIEALNNWCRIQIKLLFESFSHFHPNCRKLGITLFYNVWFLFWVLTRQLEWLRQYKVVIVCTASTTQGCLSCSTLMALSNGTRRPSWCLQWESCSSTSNNESVRIRKIYRILLFFFISSFLVHFVSTHWITTTFFP